MDGETERKIAALVLAEAQKLRARASEEGVLSYLRPQKRYRPNSQFLRATINSVESCNRNLDIQEMWEQRSKELEGDGSKEDHARANSSNTDTDIRPTKREGDRVASSRLVRCREHRATAVSREPARPSRGGGGIEWKRDRRVGRELSDFHQMAHKQPAAEARSNSPPDLEDKEDDRWMPEAEEPHLLLEEGYRSEQRSSSNSSVGLSDHGGNDARGILCKASQGEISPGIAIHHQEDDKTTAQGKATVGPQRASIDHAAGLEDAELKSFLLSRKKRGRGAVGSRMDSRGPLQQDDEAGAVKVPGPAGAVVGALLERVREEWEDRVGQSSPAVGLVRWTRGERLGPTWGDQCVIGEGGTSITLTSARSSSESGEESKLKRRKRKTKEPRKKDKKSRKREKSSGKKDRKKQKEEKHKVDKQRRKES